VAILEKVLAARGEGLQPWFVKRAAELSSAIGRVSVAGRAVRHRGFSLRRGLFSPAITFCQMLRRRT
jgi:hypothetical protein